MNGLLGPLEAEHLERLALDACQEFENQIAASPHAGWYAALSIAEKSIVLKLLLLRVIFEDRWDESRIDLFALALEDGVDRERIRALVREILGPSITRELGDPLALEHLWKAREALTTEQLAAAEDVTAYVRTVVAKSGRAHRRVFGDEGSLGARDRDRHEVDRRAALRGEKTRRTLQKRIELEDNTATVDADNRALLLAHLNRSARTDRELQMLELIAQGRSATDAARLAGVGASGLKAFQVRAKKLRKSP